MGLGIEKIIAEWVAKSPKEDLPGQGKPLDLDEYFNWPEDMRFAYSILKNAGYVPEEVNLLREVATLEGTLANCQNPEVARSLRARLQEAQVSLNMKLESRRQRH